MNLSVIRQWSSPNSTIGQLGFDGVFFCYTLEPRMDRSQGKPYAIQPGTYFLDVLRSDHFSRMYGYDFYTPRVLGVPGFDPETIEIHPGNSPAGTHGCTEVGMTRGPQPDWIGSSDIAFARLLAKLKGIGSWVGVAALTSGLNKFEPLMAQIGPGLEGSSITYINAASVTDPEIGM